MRFGEKQHPRRFHSLVETQTQQPDDLETPWQDARRVETWAGEMRVNLLRLVGIVLFYGRHLAALLFGKAEFERGRYHLQVTMIAVSWAASVILVHWALSRRVVPYWLKYATTAWDAVLITLLCVISGGPHSPMLVLYFPLGASAPLRLSLPLVW